VVRDTPDPLFGTGAHDILLSATVSPSSSMALISGQGGTASLTTSVPGQNIAYKSDFFDFSGSAGNTFGITFTGISPGLSFNDPQGGTILNSFTASGVGTFSAATIPEPASMALLGIGCLIVFGARMRKAMRAA